MSSSPVSMKCNCAKLQTFCPFFVSLIVCSCFDYDYDCIFVYFYVCHIMSLSLFVNYFVPIDRLSLFSS